MELFTYGTLMDADIMNVLLGRTLTFRKGFLNGYARHPVESTCYPGLIPAENAQTKGIVYHGLLPDDWPLLDWFEDVLYSRETVLVEMDTGPLVEAQVYVVQPDQVSALNLDADWCFEKFKREDYPTYAPMCRDARVQYLQQKRLHS